MVLKLMLAVLAAAMLSVAVASLFFNNLSSRCLVLGKTTVDTSELEAAERWASLARQQPGSEVLGIRSKSLAKSLLRLGQVTMEDSRQIRETFADDPVMMLELGTAAWKAGFPELALDIWSHAPGIEWYFLNHASAMQAAGRNDAALGYYKVGFDLGVSPVPGNIRYFHRYAELLRVTGDPQRAIEVALKAREVSKSAWISRILGLAYLDLRAYESAEVHFRESGLLDPLAERSDFWIGYCLSKQGRFSESLGYYEAALKRNEADGLAHYELGVALARLGRIQEARLHLQRSLVCREENRWDSGYRENAQKLLGQW